MPTQFFLSEKEYQNLRTSFHKEMPEPKPLDQDINELSCQFTTILEWKFTQNFLVLDIIWLFHQFRKNPSEYGPIVLAFRNIAFQQNEQYEHYLLSLDKGNLDPNHFQQVLTSLVAIAIEHIKVIDINNVPSIGGCLSEDEKKQINIKLIGYEQQDKLDEGALELKSSEQNKTLIKFKTVPEFSKYIHKLKELLDIALSNEESASLALSSINYFLDENDIISDQLGILGLIDDIYAITNTFNSIYSRNKFYNLVGHHNINFPHFRLPNIGSEQEFFPLVNLEDLVKVSYTNLEEGALKRLLVVPDVGPLPVLIALGKSITDRIGALRQATERTISKFNKGDHILFGYKETSRGRKAMVQEYIGPYEKIPDTFWCLDSEGNGQSFTSDEIKKSVRIEAPASRGRDVKRFLKEREVFSPWGSMNFSEDINEIPSCGKIFLIGRKNKMMEFLEEEIYGFSILSWLGVCYIGYDRKRNWKITPYGDVNQLFPEPQIYLISDKNIAIDILNDRWEDDSIKSESSLVICSENSFLKDDYFLSRLNKYDGNTLILNEYFNNDVNINVLEEGFEQLSARPDKYFSTLAEGFISSPLKQYFSRGEEFETRLISFSNPIQDTLREKTRLIDQEDILLKYKLSNLNFRLFQRIMKVSGDEKAKINQSLENIIEELRVLENFKPTYKDLREFLEQNKQDIVNISRIEVLNANLAHEKEYVVLAKRNEVANLNNYFLENSIKAKALTFNELDKQMNLHHLMIPIFMGKNETQKLRNFRYAQNHYFLVTEKEEQVHNYMKKIEEKLFSNTFKEVAKLDNSEEEDISIDGLEEKINDINPLKDLIQDTISRIHLNFRGQNEIHNVDTKLIILEGLKVLPLPEGGHTLKLSSTDKNNIEYVRVESLNAGDNIVLSPHISGNDLLHLMLKEDEVQYKEYLSIEKEAKKWQEALKTFSSDKNLNLEQLRIKLKDIGIERNINTIKSWVSSPDTLAPRNYERHLKGIFELTGTYTQKAYEDSIYAIKVTYKSRRNAQERLIQLLESTEINLNNNEIKLKISQSEFIFAVYSIESISSASIEPKFLYKFIDFSDLEEMEKNSIDPSL